MNEIALLHKKRSSRVFRICVLCIVLGLFFRVLYCIVYPIQPRDSYLYESTVIKWEKTGQIQEYRNIHQFSLWIMKIPHQLMKCSIIKGGIVVNMLLGMFIIIMAIKTTNIFFCNNYVLLTIGLLFSTHPSLVRYSCTFLRENSYLVFALISFFYICKYYRMGRTRFAVMSGVFCAFAYLCRLEGFESVITYCIIIVFSDFKRKDRFKRFFTPLLFCSVFFLTFLLTCKVLDIDTISVDDMKSRLDTTRLGIDEL